VVPQGTPGKDYGLSDFQKFASNKFDFENFENPQKKKNREIFCLFLFCNVYKEKILFTIEKA